MKKLSDESGVALTLISARVLKNRTQGRADAKPVRDDVEAGETLLNAENSKLRGVLDQRIGQTNEVNFRQSELASALRQLNLRLWIFAAFGDARLR